MIRVSANPLCLTFIEVSMNVYIGTFIESFYVTDEPEGKLLYTNRESFCIVPYCMLKNKKKKVYSWCSAHVRVRE